MDILKLNRISYLIILLVLFSCKKTAIKTYDNDNCKIYVAGKQGFWIDIYSEGLKESDVIFKFGNKKITPQKTEIETNNINFFINESLKLKDTITFDHKGKNYMIYDFENMKETAIDGSDHKNIGICRVSTAKINGKEIQDSRNNILKVTLE